MDNDTMPDAAKLGALEALQYLLEPIDNANGGPPYSLIHIIHISARLALPVRAHCRSSYNAGWHMTHHTCMSMLYPAAVHQCDSAVT